jgi:hypothetical protein
MSGREPHDEDTRTLDSSDPRDEVSTDTSDAGATRADERVEPVRSDPAPAERSEPLPGDRREANQREVEGDDASLSDLPPRTEERTVPPPPEPR